MRITRQIRSAQEIAIVARNPLLDPVYGDVVEGFDGERRSVEIRERSGCDRVHYRCAGGSATNDAGASLECDIVDWRSWAQAAEVLHAAHKPFEPPALRRARHRAQIQQSRAASDV